MEPLGPKLRRQRRRLGLTLDELAGRTGISKPYLSLIETGRVTNPPSDEKLRRLEQNLGFTAGELLSQAHLQRTPRDVRAMLQKLMKGQAARGEGQEVVSSPLAPGPFPLDDAYLSGMLQELVERSAGNVEAVVANHVVPVINRVSAGYPKDFTDMNYPKGNADDYVHGPDIGDKDTFAARVHGDSMQPKYREGDIIIFSPAVAAKDGDDCFVRFDNDSTTFKQVFFEFDDAGKSMIRLQPRNEKYHPQTVPAEQISGLYKAVYRYQRVD
jgi:repressor LexA